MGSIVVVGTAFVDIKGFPDGEYLAGGRNAGRVEYIHGGVGRNVAEDLANMELRPTYVGLVDESPLGRDVLEKLRRRRVNVDHVLTTPDGLGTWLAVFDSSGEVAGSISRRPHTYPLLALLEEKGEEIFSRADSVVLQADIDREVVEKVFDLAQRYGKKVYSIVSNMSIVSRRREILQRYDCFICNQQEAGMLFLEDYSGKTPEELRDIIVEKIAQEKIPAMVVTMGGKGSVYASLGGEKGVCPARKVTVRDTTGAGDSFCAGVAAGLTYGKSLAAAVETGTDLAASVITSSENVCPRFRPVELGLNYSEI
ncbi:MAG: carbohydrate kinase family protein [Oscillibacter sp.]|nr:carbohydrate kinase family protein [Oscillibacter sp.]